MSVLICQRCGEEWTDECCEVCDSGVNVSQEILDKQDRDDEAADFRLGQMRDES